MTTMPATATPPAIPAAAKPLELRFPTGATGAFTCADGFVFCANAGAVIVAVANASAEIILNILNTPI